MFSDVFSQCATSSGGTRSEIAVTAPPQTCVSTGPVAHWAPMSGPAFAAAAAWNVAMKVSVACSTTLIEMLGFFATYAVTAAAIALLAPGASASPQNHMVRSTFSPLAAVLAVLLVSAAAGVELAAVVVESLLDEPPHAASTRPAKTTRIPIHPAFDPRATTRMAPPPRSARVHRQ